MGQKQILFADGRKHILYADGRAAAGEYAVLGPEDLPALAALSRLSYKFSDTATYGGRKGYRARYKAAGLDGTAKDAAAKLLKKAMPEIRGVEVNLSAGGPYWDIYTDTSYQFLARDTVEVLQQLYGRVNGLPKVVDADEYEPTNGQTVSAGPKNYTVRMDYRVPFDREAWKRRHAEAAKVLTDDSEAARKKAEALRVQAEADQAAQKAKLMKAARVAVVAAVGLAAVALVLRMAKNRKG